MPAVPNSPKRDIQKSDVVSSATLSGILTFFLLTFSKQLEQTHWLVPYLTDHSISFFSGIATAILTFLLALFRFEISLKIHERDYKQKLAYIDKRISTTKDQKTLDELNLIRNKLTLQSTKKIVQEKI